MKRTIREMAEGNLESAYASGSHANIRYPSIARRQEKKDSLMLPDCSHSVCGYTTEADTPERYPICRTRKERGKIFKVICAHVRET